MLILYNLQLTIQGLSGEIQFDNEGRRSNIAVEVLELGSHGIFQIGLWNTSEGFTITREAPKIDNSDDGSIKNKTFVVLTALVRNASFKVIRFYRLLYCSFAFFLFGRVNHMEC